MTQINDKVNVLDLSPKKLKAFLKGLGQQPYRADQIIAWLHKHDCNDFDAMTNLSKSLRLALQAHAYIEEPEVALVRPASDRTCKFLIRLQDGNLIETVYIPEKTRATLCVSSQVGCALNCDFCATGKEGFNRNLTMAEIISQLRIVRRWVAKQNNETLSNHEAINKEDRFIDDKRQARKDEIRGKSRRESGVYSGVNEHFDEAFNKEDRFSRLPDISNVVFMGMGEPLLNYVPVVEAIDLMLSDDAYGLSKYKVTLSTSGMIPQMLQLKEDSECALAVSLHAPNDEVRTQLVPLNKKYPLKELMAVCRDYFERHPRRKVTFEYVMLDGINDTLEHAKQLVKLVSDVPCKMNLIPFNPFEGSHFTRSSDAQVERFQKYLVNHGVDTWVRKTRGDDVSAACGQLVGDIKDRTGRHERWKKTNYITVQKLKE